MPVLVFHLSVVLEKTHIIDGRLNPQYAGEFVIHLDARRPHVMLDAAPLDPCGQSRTDLLRQLWRDLFAQEARDTLGVGRQNRLAGKGVIQWNKNLFTAKHQVGGVVDLSQTPMIDLPKHVEHRAKPLRILIQPSMQQIGAEGVGQLLRTRQISNAQEGVVLLEILDPFTRQRSCQGAMPIAIELQAKRCPGGNTQIAQPKFFVDYIEVVMQAFAWYRLQVRLAIVLVVPGLVTGTGFHGRNDMHQAGSIATRGQHARNQFFFAKVALAHMLDLNPRFGADLMRPITNPVAQRFGKLRVVKNPNALLVKKARHTLRVTRTRLPLGDVMHYQLHTKTNADLASSIKDHVLHFTRNLAPSSIEVRKRSDTLGLTYGYPSQSVA